MRARAEHLLQNAQAQADQIVSEARDHASRLREESDRELAAASAQRDSITAQLCNVRQMLATLGGGALVDALGAPARRPSRRRRRPAVRSRPRARQAAERQRRRRGAVRGRRVRGRGAPRPRRDEHDDAGTTSEVPGSTSRRTTSAAPARSTPRAADDAAGARAWTGASTTKAAHQPVGGLRQSCPPRSDAECVGSQAVGVAGPGPSGDSPAVVVGSPGCRSRFRARQRRPARPSSRAAHRADG